MNKYRGLGKILKASAPACFHDGKEVIHPDRNTALQKTVHLSFITYPGQTNDVFTKLYQ